MVGTLSQWMNALINQAAKQTSPLLIPMSSLVPLFGQFELFGLEILDDRSSLISLMHGFPFISAIGS
jgi:hypothetical protein